MDDRDERLGSDEDGAPPRRAHRGAKFARDSRAVLDERVAQERGFEERDQSEDREMVDGDRLQMFRDSLEQSVLPDLPKMDGYHTCWLTTSNPRDTIPWRRRLGYELIPQDELPGWQGAGVESAAYPGMITVNEMIAARIKLDLYNAYMREVHDTKPRGEEEKLRSQVENMKHELGSKGLRVQEGDGTESIVQRAPPMPPFLS